MSFLAPLFLLGGLAVGLPIVFHLIRRSSRERVPFSSLMFLLPTPPRVTRRSKLENVFLLLLRCLVIGLLAFAFARPYLSKPVAPDPSAAASQKIVVLLDTSASMRRGKLWTEAQDKAKAIVRSAGSADKVACFTFDQALHPLVSFEQWTAVPAGDRAALAAKQIDSVSPGWDVTRLGSALINASELFESTAKNEQGPKRIVVITDLQEGSHLEGLQGYEWPHGIEVSVETLKPARTSNAGLQLASERADFGKTAIEAVSRVRISNASDSKREQFQVGWRHAEGQGFVGGTVDAYVPPGQSRVVAVPRPAGDSKADRIGLVGDEEEFDNTAYVVPLKAEHTRILFLGSDSATDSTRPLYYLKRAFQETPKLEVEVTAKDPATPLGEADLTEARLAIISSSLPEETVQALRRFLDAGKAALLVLSDAGMGSTVERLTGADGLSVEESQGGNYAMLGQIDFEHPLFAPFAEPRYSDFTKIHFWKHRRVALDKVAKSRILARFDNGDPALAEVPVGKGKIWVLASGWRPEDSQLALSSKFVPLLYAMLEQSGGLKQEHSQYVVGDAVVLPEDAQAVTVRKPDTSEVRWARGSKFTADEPGIYTITSVQPPVSFAVNLAPEESKTAPLPVEELERLGVPLQRQPAVSPKQLQQRREHLQAVELEQRQKLWRWLIVVALVVLVVETWVAGHLTHRSLIVSEQQAQA